MPAPLDGMLVLDWTIWQQGPVCSSMLGDMGARVIKLEQRGSGDPGRYLLAAGGVASDARPNWYFEATNRSKESIAVDLKNPEGLAVAHALAEKADVFVQNFRKGVAERIGLGYEQLRAKNPRLVYASVSGYGPHGPDSAEPAFDHLGLARSGMMNSAGEPDMPPQALAGGIADQMGATVLAYGVLHALLARERFGAGQKVETSQLGAMAFLQNLSLSMRLMTGHAIPRSFRAAAANPLWNHYLCADDAWLALGMLQPDRYWAHLTRALGRPELADDARFCDMQARAQNARACIALLDEIFASAPRAHWLRVLRESEGDLIYTVLNRVDDLPGDPQMTANDYIVTLQHPQHGPTPMVGLPVALSATPGAVRAAAPELGQHTETVLTELLGWSWERVAALRACEAI